MGIKDFFTNAPLANYGPYLLHRDGSIEKVGGSDKGRHSLAGVGVELERGSDLQKRVTATRFIATGIFSLALKKKSGGEWWLTFEGEDFAWLEEVPFKRQAAARQFIQKVKQSQRELAKA